MSVVRPPGPLGLHIQGQTFGCLSSGSFSVQVELRLPVFLVTGSISVSPSSSRVNESEKKKI